MTIQYSDQHHVAGTFAAAATPASEAISLGFKPSYVKVQNVTTILMGEHHEGMADDSYLLTTGSTGVQTLPTSAGITLSTNGFAVGTGVQGSADDVLYWIAYR